MQFYLHVTLYIYRHVKINKVDKNKIYYRKLICKTLYYQHF